MTDFSTIAARLDTAVFSRLSDPATIDGRPVRGMFRAPWMQPAMGSMQTGLNEPTLVVRDADVANTGQGSLVVNAGKTFDVVGIEPDGTGTTTLVLRLRLP